jgi:putative transposase
MTTRDFHVTLSGMGNPRGVKRDFVALERRRLRAARLLSQGVSPAEVARQVGAHRQSVGRWAQELEANGLSGLKRAGRAGRKPRLTAEHLARIEQALKRGPRAFGYATELWTARRVRDLITQQCGVKFSPRHVWWLLGQMSWSCQRPTGRAREWDEQAIRRWKRRRWPELKKTPNNKPKPSSSSTRAD